MSTVDSSGLHVAQVAVGKLFQLVERLDRAALQRLVEEELSPADFFLRLVESAPADPPLARARARGLRLRQEILQQDGGVVGAREFAAHAHRSHEWVYAQSRNGKLVVATDDPLRLPLWQLDEQGRPLPGLEEILAELARRTESVWAKFTFFLKTDDRLDGKRPIDVLRGRGAEEGAKAVLACAATYLEQGTI